MKSELLSATVPERWLSCASHSSREIISSPVGMKRLFALLFTGTSSMPAQRKREISAGVTGSPSRAIICPAMTSSPRGRTFAEGVRAL